MVVAMVRFSVALVNGAPGSPAGRWGLAYGASWAAILALAWRITGDADDRDAPVLVTLIVAAWGAFHAFWIWLALGMVPARAGARQLAGRLAVLGLALVAIAAVRLADLGSLTTERLGALPIMILMALTGVVLMIAGGVRKATRDKRAMTFDRDADSDEVEEEYARRNTEAQPSLKGSLDPATFVVGLGAALMITGAFGAGIVAGPPAVKVLCGGALAFVAFQAARGRLRRR